MNLSLMDDIEKPYIQQIIEDAVQTEIKFFYEYFDKESSGINPEFAKQYIRDNADNLLVKLGYGKKYSSETL